MSRQVLCACLFAAREDSHGGHAAEVCLGLRVHPSSRATARVDSPRVSASSVQPWSSVLSAVKSQESFGSQKRRMVRFSYSCQCRQRRPQLGTLRFSIRSLSRALSPLVSSFMVSCFSLSLVLFFPPTLLSLTSYVGKNLCISALLLRESVRRFHVARNIWQAASAAQAADRRCF